MSQIARFMPFTSARNFAGTFDLRALRCGHARDIVSGVEKMLDAAGRTNGTTDFSRRGNRASRFQFAAHNPRRNDRKNPRSPMPRADKAIIMRSRVSGFVATRNGAMLAFQRR
jgi:hypothetical protein